MHFTKPGELHVLVLSLSLRAWFFFLSVSYDSVSSLPVWEGRSYMKQVVGVPSNGPLEIPSEKECSLRGKDDSKYVQKISVIQVLNL